MSEQTETIIKFEQPGEQIAGGIRRVVGFVKAKSFIGIIDALDLGANPRSSKVGPVTNAIQESMDDTPSIFPFKTKGVLLAAADYEKLERGRYRVIFTDEETEGILDGGHNALAIGLFILDKACVNAGVTSPRGIKLWSDFKEEWESNRPLIASYQEDLRKDEQDCTTVTDLDVLIPVELLLPADITDYGNVSEFKTNLLDICAARNNNVQLTIGTKANKHGYFDELKSIFARKSPDLAKRIEWKTNDGGEIKVVDIIALTWIPLSLVDPVMDDQGKRVDPPTPTHFYSGKAGGLEKFERLMSSEDVTTSPSGDYRKELKSTEVESAFKIAADLPALYDYIYEVFPDLYNHSGGTYGRITAVKKLNEHSRVKKTPFLKKDVNTKSPDGFIAPLVYGLQVLLTVDVDPLGHKEIVWREDPMPWLQKHLPGIVKRYSNDLAPWGYDPQKVGKAPGSYDHVMDAYKMELAGLD